jgi:LysR family cys regulon transcriptional activator
MNFQQLKYVRAAVQNDLNLTKVANELATSQSGVSKQIKELEAELKLEIFVRRGKRLVGLTPAGDSAARVIDRLLQEADNLKRLSDQFVQADKGRLIVAATHNQSSYVLPQALLAFSREFPEVHVELRQGSPAEVVALLASGEADIGVATEAVDGHPGLQTIPCFTWEHVAIVPPDHPLAALAAPTLADIAQHAIITYNPGFTGRSQINEAFAEAGLSPDIHLTATDADVIKTYVRLGMGVGIIAQMAIDNGPDAGVVTIANSNRFFKPSSTKIAIPNGALLRNYAYRMIELLAPHVDTQVLSGKRRARPNDKPPRILSFAERPDLRFGAQAGKEGSTE